MTRGLKSYLIGRRLGVRKISIASDSFLRGLAHIRIGENFQAGKGLWLQTISEYEDINPIPKITIGENFSISYWGHIAAVDCIEIGANVMVGSKVTIIDHNHGSYGPETHCNPETPPRLRPLISRRIAIGSNVWIGDGVVIVAGAEIGEGCIIGANSVVTGRIPAFTIAVGAPARPVKEFSFEKGKWLKCHKE
jgi:acetyltransferase-like isoleucine patch superfamily enzyme